MNHVVYLFYAKRTIEIEEKADMDMISSKKCSPLGTRKARFSTELNRAFEICRYLAIGFA